MILIGAAVGAISYTISEAISYSLINKWSWPWEQFAGSIVGGAVGGVIGGILGACKFVAPHCGIQLWFCSNSRRNEPSERIRKNKLLYTAHSRNVCRQRIGIRSIGFSSANWNPGNHDGEE